MKKPEHQANTGKQVDNVQNSGNSVPRIPNSKDDGIYRIGLARREVIFMTMPNLDQKRKEMERACEQETDETGSKIPKIFCLSKEEFSGTSIVRAEDGTPCLFTSEKDAQRQIAVRNINRWQSVLDGELAFTAAAAMEESVQPFAFLPNGNIKVGSVEIEIFPPHE